MFDQLSRLRRPQAGRQRDGQPLQEMSCGWDTATALGTSSSNLMTACAGSGTGRTVAIAGKQRQGQTSQSSVKIASARIKTGMRRLRISAISYLNTAPLMWDFEHGEAGRDFDISYTLPSACARCAGRRDRRHRNHSGRGLCANSWTCRYCPDVAIASRRAVRSILLVSRVPVEKIRTVALDTSSMTSVALTKILFEKWLGGGRTFTSMAPDIDKMLAEHDAGLLIGDPALQIDRSRYFTLDLAEEWIRHTGKPFVFAFWAVRSFAGTRIMRWWGQPPSPVRVAKRRSCTCRSGHDLSAIPRSRTRTRKPRSHRPRVGSKTRHQRSRCSFLSHRKYLLPSRRRLSRRPATLLSLCG